MTLPFPSAGLGVERSEPGGAAEKQAGLRAAATAHPAFSHCLASPYGAT